MAIGDDLATHLRFIPAGEVVLPKRNQSQVAELEPVIVSLPRRSDRWHKVVRELAAVGVGRMSRFPAIDGAALSEVALAPLVTDQYQLSSSPSSHTQLTRPAIGCFLSHLKIWQQFLDGDSDRLVILEDDVLPSPNYSTPYAQEILSAIPRDADLVLLGGSIMAGLAEATASRFLHRLYYFNGTYAYLITRKGCANLLPHLLPMRAHLDHQISGALVSHRHCLVAYAAIPSLFDHDFTSWSDVYVPIEDGEGADRQLDAVLRSARHTLRKESTVLLNVDAAGSYAQIDPGLEHDR